jgi:hypothetical protein
MKIGAVLRSTAFSLRNKWASAERPRSIGKEQVFLVAGKSFPSELECRGSGCLVDSLDRRVKETEWKEDVVTKETAERGLKLRVLRIRRMVHPL